MKSLVSQVRSGKEDAAIAVEEGQSDNDQGLREIALQVNALALKHLRVDGIMQ